MLFKSSKGSLIRCNDFISILYLTVGSNGYVFIKDNISAIVCISHSTFIAFAPKENPKIAIAVYVENSGWGSSYAAPIASLIIEKYLKGEISESRKELEKSMLEANLMNKYMKIPVDSPQAD